MMNQDSSSQVTLIPDADTSFDLSSLAPVLTEPAPVATQPARPFSRQDAVYLVLAMMETLATMTALVGQAYVRLMDEGAAAGTTAEAQGAATDEQ